MSETEARVKVHAVRQGSAEWLALRIGIPTASEFHNLITPNWKIRTGKMPDSYLAAKLAEKWRGAPLHTFSGGAAEQGQILEEEAIPWYELTRHCDLVRPGFISRMGCGCSPDALVMTSGVPFAGVEIKCPEPQTHVKWLLDRRIPDEHLTQVWGGMYVTNLLHWVFVSYCRGFPALVVEVEATREEYAGEDNPLTVIADATGKFLLKFEQSWKRLLDLNGGPR